jgi:YfiH family protein
MIQTYSNFRKFDLKSVKGVIYFIFPSLSSHDRLFHGVFTRIGGTSKPPYESLNTGHNTGDKPENVNRNLRIIRETVKADHLLFMNQVHGDHIITLRKNNHPDIESIADADAIVTDIPNVAIMVKQADCQGVILFDPVKGVVSIVHCGWRGNVRNILGSVVKRMKSEFECGESDISAAIGPSLGPCCAEFITYKELFPDHFMKFMVRNNYFDLWEISRSQLLQAGLSRNSIEIAGVCTKCKTELFYSHRAEGTTGRFATVAMLQDDHQ